ncbi:MAG: hypothetical protein RR317_01750, partial [Bilophila sp.]
KLFFSMKLENAYDVATKTHLTVHGNTGFSPQAAWNAQPGRFTERISVAASYSSNKAYWFYDYDRNDTGNFRDGGTTAWWIVPPVAEQIVLVCPTFILVALRVAHVRNDQSLFTGWVPLLFGAADGLEASETELNMVVSSAWGMCQSIGYMLSWHYTIPGNVYNYLEQRSTCATVGLLYKGVNVEKLPAMYDMCYEKVMPASMVRTSVFATPRTPLNVTGCTGDPVTRCGESFMNSYKGIFSSGVPVYDAAVVQNPGTLRQMLVKPLLYVCQANKNMRVVGELPYYAVNMSALKPKDVISIGNRFFMVLPNVHDSDTIGIAVEVVAEAAGGTKG